MNRISRSTLLLAALTLLTPVLAAAGGWCDDHGGRYDRGHHCEVRELTVAAGRSVIEVDAGPNGGISVTAWDRDEILIEAKVAGNADSDGEAADLVSQVRIETAGVIQADGPRGGHDENWWVSFRLHVPRSSNLDLEAHNGGISIAGVVGELRFDTTNGGIGLEGVGGDVRGETTNGGIKVELSGDSWQGAGLDVETTNGGIKMLVPRQLQRAPRDRHHERSSGGRLPAHAPGQDRARDRGRPGQRRHAAAGDDDQWRSADRP